MNCTVISTSRPQPVRPLSESRPLSLLPLILRPPPLPCLGDRPQVRVSAQLLSSQSVLLRQTMYVLQLRVIALVAQLVGGAAASQMEGHGIEYHPAVKF